MAADVGTGTTFTFSGFTYQVTAIRKSETTRGEHKTSHLATATAHTWVPGDLVDSGVYEFDFWWDPAITPPITGATGSMVITFPDSSTATANVFLRDYNSGVELEELMGAGATFRVDGAITYA